MQKNILLLVCLFFLFLNAYAEDMPLLPSNINTLSNTIIERNNFSFYLNTVYQGHVYKENRTVFINNGKIARIFELEELLKDATLVEKEIKEVIDLPIQNVNNLFFIKQENGIPEYAKFPYFLDTEVKADTKWIFESTRQLKLPNLDSVIELPVLTEYEYAGTSVYYSIPVFIVKAKFATRYKAETKKNPDLKVAEGTHNLTILVDISSETLFMITDSYDETFVLNDTTKMRMKGIKSIFYTIPNRMEIGTLKKDSSDKAIGNTEENDKNDASNLNTNNENITKIENATKTEDKVSELKKEVKDLGIADLSVNERPEGTSLVLEKLLFKANTSLLLANEKNRLDALAELLKKLKDSTILVEGHTAKAGTKQEQDALALARAKTIIKELVARGIPASRFIYKSYGAEKPLAPNDSEENMAKNRRVELVLF